MESRRTGLFQKRHFAAEIIVTCVRWYLRFSLSLRDIEELMAERGLCVDHTTIWRWTQTYAPEVQRRLHGQLKPKGSTWHIDETFVKIAGQWMYLFRAVDSSGQTVDFYLSETRDRLRSYPAAIRELQNEGQLRRSCRHRTRRYANNRIESDHRHIKWRLRAMQGPRTMVTR